MDTSEAGRNAIEYLMNLIFNENVAIPVIITIAAVVAIVVGVIKLAHKFNIELPNIKFPKI